MAFLEVSRPSFLDDEDVLMFERSVERFVAKNASESAQERWRENKNVGRDVWREAGKNGLLGVSVPEAYGGAGGDFRHEVAIIMGLGRQGAESISIGLHNPVVLPYLTEFGSELQKQRWLPGLCTGDKIGAIAMTEPAAGSDLQGMTTTAKRIDNGFVLNGQKTFISTGQLANVIIVAAKTDVDAGTKGISLLVVDTDIIGPGFARGRNLEKVGQEAQDTSELFFDDLFVPTDCLLGEVEGQGLRQLMAKLPQERLVIGWQSMAMIERALGETLAYVKARKIFGQQLVDFQNSQFKLAEFKTEATIAKVFLEHCTVQLLQDRLDGATASMAKYWVSDTLGRIVDGCVQLFGGYGYMLEYPIARMYRDARIHRIYGGANEVMKLLIARTL